MKLSYYTKWLWSVHVTDRLRDICGWDVLGTQRSMCRSLMMVTSPPFLCRLCWGDESSCFGITVHEHPKWYSSGLRMSGILHKVVQTHDCVSEQPEGKSEELWTCYSEVVCLSWLFPYLVVHYLAKPFPSFFIYNRKTTSASRNTHLVPPS